MQKENISIPLIDRFRELAASPDGLKQVEAEERLLKYGRNEMPEKAVNPFLKFFSYFWGPIPWMVEIALILSAVIGHWPDFFIILTLLCANGLIGYWEEHKADNAIAALKAQLAVRAKVRRDGAWTTLDAVNLVPGDIIRLRLGDIIPADAYVLEGDPIEVDQSALTGESLPVQHQTAETVFSGSIVRQGEIDALVCRTGKDTFFGKTVQLVEEAYTESHFQRAVLKIGDYLIVLAFALVTIILIVALFRGDSFLMTLQFALVLMVAAIPVAMPTVLSVTMAVGAHLLAKMKAIVRRLTAIEELAGVDVLCTDKTGTLTQNKLTLGEPFCAEGITRDVLLVSAALASRQENRDVIDLAVIEGLSHPDSIKSFTIQRFIPFDPVRKRTEAEVRGLDGATYKVTKGAPQVVLALASDKERIAPAVEKAIEGFARRGYRSLGVARTNAQGEWIFLGVLPLHDPLWEDSKPTIAIARDMGLRVKMVTGDQVAIARETARQLDLGDRILDASELTSDHGAWIIAAVENADGFAQVFPEHKYHIVDELQRAHHIVAMTGDGVNDAPALKKADCGIAVAGSTDAARAAADIVLMVPGLSVIIDAIKESRNIFQRMNSYAIYRITETLRVLLFMTASILVFNFYPVTAIMIVMLALLNDGAILSIAYDNVQYSKVPEAWNMHEVLGIATLLGSIGLVASFGLFYIAQELLHLTRPMIQTLIYLKLSVAGHMTIFLTRTRGPFWSHRPSNILLWAVFGTQGIATLIAVYGVLMEPIGWPLAGMVWLYALAWFLLNDRLKLCAYRVLDRRRSSLLATWFCHRNKRV